ncbi:cytochrome c oxidase subunit 3 [Rhodopila globiformis]|uniref:Cytochrome c oxidase subunit 3 n=1 Tax=Rhodopila globiformis TaxID=1071 RepID=A0A2S6NKQ6_RHOGL|nr:cytochrome c oxidase subunit 3 [Rhodopila globiformis]PPQ35620.1 cytochrome c oxidase subunit 3 [Rhodopila globiformis]
MSSDVHGSTVSISSGLKQPYHLPNPSPWPIIGAIGGFGIVFGIVLAAHYGNYIVLILGALTVLTTMFFWWRDVVRESRTPGAHSPIVRLSLRYGMTLFIASEVMFFVGFFWAYFNFLIFPHTQGDGQTVWPPSNIHTFAPFHLPFLNTMILLLSGTTVTWAHHALLEKNRRDLLLGLGLTILLGMSFTVCQAIEYSHAPFKFNGGGVYPSTFFLATGFHGFHVIVGTIFLIVCWFRAKAGQFTPERHFGFEAAAWYWHFVDVVWLFLFTCIYWYGAGQIAPE